MKNLSADIVEIFSSIQGEGPYIGQKHIFVRFSGCNLSCKYCDTEIIAGDSCKIYEKTKIFREIKNPVHSKELSGEIKKINPELHHSISLTGGEPLLHAEFLEEFLNNTRSNFPYLKIYLETNGTLPEKFKLISPYIDIVSMDIKLESSTTETMPFIEHVEFIKILDFYNIEFFIKIVVTPDIKKKEIELVKNLVKTSKRAIPLILQPESRRGFEEKLLYIQDELIKELNDVRIIPQVHKYLGLN